jgi:alkylhydroperoxidase family enzyme
VLGNNPPVLDVFRRTLGELRRTSGLSDRHRGLVILALARELDCEYMWHRHVTVALAGPLSRDDVLAVADGGFTSFEDDERAVLRYAVAFARQAVDDERHRRVVEALDPASVVGLAMFAGCYLGMMMYVIDALDVEPADAFVGWDLSNLPPGAG